MRLRRSVGLRGCGLGITAQLFFDQRRRIPGQRHLLVCQQVVDVDAAGRDTGDVLHVARRQRQVAIFERVNDQRGAFESERCERRDEIFRAVRLQLEAVDDDQPAFAQPLGEHRADGAAPHLLRDAVRPVARLRPVDVATAFPERRAQRSDAGAACALLLPELLARAAHVAARLGGAGAGALICHVGFDRFVNQRLVERRAEHVFRQRQLADFFVLEILNLHNRHCLAPQC